MSIESKSDEFLWVEKYRPRKIDDCILPETMKKTFNDIIATGQIPHMILAGPAGISKTTCALAICNAIGAETLMINASMESGIDVLRTKILQFASTVSFGDGIKVVILDEADYLNCFDASQEVLVLRDNEIVKLPISELENKSETVLSVDSSGNLEFDTAHGFQSGEQDVYEVTFEDGSVMICTKDHPFFDNELNEAFIEDGKDLYHVNNDKINQLLNSL